MNNVKHLLTVTAAWTSIVYTVCFLGVWLVPGIREGFMLYGLHTTTVFGENVVTFSTFVTGLIIWNIIAVLAVWLFAYLYKAIRA